MILYRFGVLSGSLIAFISTSYLRMIRKCFQIRYFAVLLFVVVIQSRFEIT
jgi:hypothetical protein